MKQTKIISKTLHYLCYVLAVGYLGTFIYSVFCLVTGFATKVYENGLYVHLQFPFTDRSFLITNNDHSYMVFSFLLPILLYGLFFLLSARLFKVFYQPRLFTTAHVAEARRFYLFNIFVPLPLVIISSFFVEIENVIWVLIFVHFILGIFSLFFANIFTQGLQLQDEQDLYI